MTDYQRVLLEIFEHVDYSRSRQIPYNASTYNLGRMRELCKRLGNPQDQYPSLHIAGSKGKGSTAAMATAILQAAGYRTGLYTSPHLHSFRERMRIDGELITQEQLIELWGHVRPIVRSLERTTTFEIITALAFMHFSRSHVGWAVMEVGLGGRLDATNVIQSQACAITSLSFEHTDLLGHTLSLIAFEKAGIIKYGNPVVVGPQAPEAISVIEDVAEQTGAKLWHVGDAHEHQNGSKKVPDWRWILHKADSSGLWLDIVSPDVKINDIVVPLVGYHQAANATVAVALVHTLRQSGIEIPVAAIRDGLAQTYWPGRLERLNEEPLIIVDSAHNGQSAERLEHSLQLFQYKRLILIFGASADKDIQGMLAVLAPQAAAILVTRSFHPRAAEPKTLAELAREIAPDVPVHVFDDAIPALELATSWADKEDLILVTGSIFVVAAAREAWRDISPGSLPPEDWAYQAEPIDGEFAPMLKDSSQHIPESF
ncbi:MAG: bifunctional folylpolyglutamate synthase/dihydrofolate synthase [Chloroflexi bacterium]|nr:bifunctional folylpolyglutamate synthase/dihydrofolate synthase [Chloroflexota bacterium]